MEKVLRNLIVLISIYNCIQFIHAVPQIFTDSYSFCKHDFGGKNLIFPDKLWSIETSNFVLHFSFCKSLQDKCKSRSSSCLIKKGTNEIIDVGREFTTGDSDEFTLESINGAKCPHSGKNYSIIVNFECSDTIKSKPRLMALEDENECSFEVTMMKPDCRPKCTDLIHGTYLIDIRNFPKNIDVTSDSRKFSFSLCGSTRKCGSRNISSCEINNGIYIPLAKLESQSLNFAIENNELTARGRFKEGREIRQFQVLIKCNWKSTISKVEYKKVPEQGKNYKFELESSYGCVKLPQDCLVKSIDNLNYNLSALSNTNGWQVANVPQGKITVNICGSLKQPKNDCSDQYSQICHFQNQKYINRGSILSSLTAHEDVITAVFSSGTTCIENAQLLYTTEIKFKCSKTEKGPIFKEFRGCVTILVWESPYACPVDFYKSQNCYLNDRLGNRNLQKLFTQVDNVHPLSPDGGVKLVYNLCGPIHTTCNHFNNVSFCLKTKQKQDVIIGWDNREVIGDKGLARMELDGDTCLNRRTRGRVTVNFICNYEDPSPPPQISIVEDGCKFRINIFTPHACLSESKFPDCVVNKGDVCYDLSPLVYKNRNYVVAGDRDTEYILNVCGPIVSGSGALCKGNAMSCLRNKTEINVKHQFTSLGVVSRPKFLNNSLIIESNMGKYCEGSGYYKTIIYFECSQRKFGPKFLSKDPCTYKFIWRTPEACPIKKSCIITNSKSESSLNLTDLEEKILKINVDNGTNTYEFNLCTESYVKQNKGGSDVFPLTREFYQKNHIQYLALDLENNCTSDSVIKKVIFEFQCDNRTGDFFSQKSFENCILEMAVRTNIVCSSKKDFYSMETQTTHLHPELTPALKEHKENKCVVESHSTGYEFKIRKLDAKEVPYENNNYALNFDSSLIHCDGLLCSNYTRIIPIETCPSVFFNDTHTVKLQYSSQSLCAPKEFFQLEVWLKCDHNKAAERVIEVQACRLTVEYNLPEACFLFVESAVPTAAIVSGVTGGMVVLGSLIILYLNRKRCSRLRYINLSLHSKDAVPVYMRDSTE